MFGVVLWDILYSRFTKNGWHKHSLDDSISIIDDLTKTKLFTHFTVLWNIL